MKAVRALGLLVLAGVLGLVANRAHRVTDEGRFAARRARQAAYQPNGEALRVAALGQPTLLADVMWVRAVLQFSEVMDGRTLDGNRWLAATVEAVATLDPGWRTAYFYGGAFMRVLGDIEASDHIFEEGRKAIPDDSFFPFSLGMNAYLHHGDAELAAEYLAAAAALSHTAGPTDVGSLYYVLGANASSSRVKQLQQMLQMRRAAEQQQQQGGGGGGGGDGVERQVDRLEL